MIKTLSASANGSPPSETAEFPAAVVSGDFTYLGNDLDLPGGDGINDRVSWEFDCTGTPMSALDPLQSAVLLLTVTPTNDGIETDSVEIKGLPPIVSPDIQTLPVGVASTISLQLLDHYSSADILGALVDAKLPMLWQDDVIITYARLDLTQ